MCTVPLYNTSRTITYEETNTTQQASVHHGRNAATRLCRHVLQAVEQYFVEQVPLDHQDAHAPHLAQHPPAHELAMADAVEQTACHVQKHRRRDGAHRHGGACPGAVLAAGACRLELPQVQAAGTHTALYWREHVWYHDGTDAYLVYACKRFLYPTVARHGEQHTKNAHGPEGGCCWWAQFAPYL